MPKTARIIVTKDKPPIVPPIIGPTAVEWCVVITEFVMDGVLVGPPPVPFTVAEAELDLYIKQIVTIGIMRGDLVSNERQR